MKLIKVFYDFVLILSSFDLFFVDFVCSKLAQVTKGLRLTISCLELLAGISWSFVYVKLAGFAQTVKMRGKWKF